MRLLVLSDLHLEFSNFAVPKDLEFDAVVLAGDIHSPGEKVVHWARRASVFGEDVPIFFVPGNHEYYGHSLDTGLHHMTEAAAGSNFHVMHGVGAYFGGVRFLGVALWTDFQMPFRPPRSGADEAVCDVELALPVANRKLNDFRKNKVPSTRLHPAMGVPERHLTAEDTLAMHWQQRSWLRLRLMKQFDGPTVVITHHGPSADSVHAQYRGDPLTPAFVSDLADEFFDGEGAPVLWIHGHIHDSADYRRGGCRVVANPRGYPRSGTSGFENPHFDAGMVIDRPVGRSEVSRAQETEQLVDWMCEIHDIDRRHPPPPLPLEVRALLNARSIRAFTGGTVGSIQDAEERARIDAALNRWPP